MSNDLQKELDEQCRLLGLSGERELKLLTVIKQMREALEYYKREYDTDPCDNLVAKTAISEADKVLGEL